MPQVCAPARLLPEVGVNSAEKTQIKAALCYLTTPQTNLKRLSHPVLVLPTAGVAQDKEMIGAPHPWSGLAPVLRLHRADGAGRGTSSAPVPRERHSAPCKGLKKPKKQRQVLECPRPRVVPKGLGSSQPQGQSHHRRANVARSCPSPGPARSKGGLSSPQGELQIPRSGSAKHQRLLPVFVISAAGLGDAQDPSPSHHHYLRWIPTRGWVNRQRTFCHLLGQPEIWSERDVKSEPASGMV